MKETFYFRFHHQQDRKLVILCSHRLARLINHIPEIPQLKCLYRHLPVCIDIDQHVLFSSYERCNPTQTLLVNHFHVFSWVLSSVHIYFQTSSRKQSFRRRVIDMMIFRLWSRASFILDLGQWNKLIMLLTNRCD